MNDKTLFRRATIRRLKNEKERIKALLDAYPNSKLTESRKEKLRSIKLQLLELGALNGE